MAGFVLRRAGQAVFVLWAAFTVTFLVLYVLPGDPIEIMLDARGEGMVADAADVAAMRAQYGFDKPLALQYVTRLWQALDGDFGTSVQLGRPVTQLVLHALPSTLELAAAALGLALVLGLLLAIVASYVRHPWLRGFLLSVPALGISVPGFWLGLLLLQVFSFRLPWFPAMGNAGLAAIVLPAITLAVPIAASYAQLLTRSLIEGWGQAYVTVALAKGARSLRVHLVHVLPNAMLPTLTLIGVSIGHLLAGAVVAETVFSRSGIGRLLEQAVVAQDVPMVQGLVVLSTLVFVVVNFGVDLLYPLIDPRLQRHRRARTPA